MDCAFVSVIVAVVDIIVVVLILNIVIALGTTMGYILVSFILAVINLIPVI